jgi:DNA replication initiation complex subunit (GINS family)
LDLKELFEIWKKQNKNKHKIIEINENFYSEVSKFIKNLEKELEEVKNLEFEDHESFKKLFLKKEKTLIESKALIEKIFKIRTALLINLAFKYAFSEAILNVKGISKEEKIFLEKILEEIKEYKIKVLKKILKGEDPNYGSENKDEEEPYYIVAAIDYIPQFIGFDLKVYGPFEPEEVFTIPETNYKILKEKNKVKLITKID